MFTAGAGFVAAAVGDAAGVLGPATATVAAVVGVDGAVAESGVEIAELVAESEFVSGVELIAAGEGDAAAGTARGAVAATGFAGAGDCVGGNAIPISASARSI